jgi:hypothetical protein
MRYSRRLLKRPWGASRRAAKELIPTHTVFWAAGITAAPVVRSNGPAAMEWSAAWCVAGEDHLINRWADDRCRLGRFWDVPLL